ncbi:MAG: hypothetical protein Q9164_001714 [Protoblastenia rupestris]
MSDEVANPSLAALPPLSPIEEQEDDSQPGLHIRGSQGEMGSKDVRTADAKMEDFISDAPLDIQKLIPLDKLSGLLFSRQHLQFVLEDQNMSNEFKAFVHTHRPGSVPLLARYINLDKALKSITYAEAIMQGLEAVEGHPFTKEASRVAMPWVIQGQIDKALDFFLIDDFRAFIAHFYVKIAVSALADSVMGDQNQADSGMADGLAEVFVLSDPARPDNMIIYSSEGFQEMTGYSRKEFLGRNCRVLGGPKTSPLGIRRFRASLEAEQEHCEVLLN